MRDIPHLSFPPFQLNPLTGRPKYVEQDSTADVAACVANLVSCPQGANPTDPAFGVPSMLFANLPINTQGITASLAEYEPRLNDTSLTQVLDPDGFVEYVAEQIVYPVLTLLPTDLLFPGGLLGTTISPVDVSLDILGFTPDTTESSA